jgi:hypothetical protein
LVDNNILADEDEAHKALENLVDRIDEQFANITNSLSGLFSTKNE